MSYGVYNFDNKNGIITFYSTNNNDLYPVNLKKDYNDYRPPNTFHYYNEELNEVILYNFDKSTFRPFFTKPPEVEYCGRIYKRCTQYNFDKWHNKEFPDTHNAIIFRILNYKFG